MVSSCKNFMVLLSMFFLCHYASAQQTFKITDASKNFDIIIAGDDCEELVDHPYFSKHCRGEFSFSFVRKSSRKPFKVISPPDSNFYVKLTNGVFVPYENQGGVYVGDYNFDGVEDVAVNEGIYGFRGEISYSIYLGSSKQHTFVYSKPFTEIATYPGMFQVNPIKKRLYSKGAGLVCCQIVFEEFDVVNNAPRLIFREVTDSQSDNKREITTRRLVNGKWKTKIRYENVDDNPPPTASPVPLAAEKQDARKPSSP